MILFSFHLYYSFYSIYDFIQFPFILQLSIYLCFYSVSIYITAFALFMNLFSFHLYHSFYSIYDFI